MFPRKLRNTLQPSLAIPVSGEDLGKCTASGCQEMGCIGRLSHVSHWVLRFSYRLRSRQNL